jgi:hypothetical protein
MGLVGYFAGSSWADAEVIAAIAINQMLAKKVRPGVLIEIPFCVAAKS